MKWYSKTRYILWHISALFPILTIVILTLEGFYLAWSSGVALLYAPSIHLRILAFLIKYDPVVIQVYELHRVYRVQREMMEEAKRRELYHHHRSIETSLSSSVLPSQLPYDEVRNRQTPSFPLANPSCIRPSILGSEVIDSPSSCTKGHNSEADLIPYQNRCDPKELAFLDSRPSKVKKKLFDHQVPAEKYVLTEKEEQFRDIEMSNTTIYSTSGNHRLSPGNSIKKYCGSGKTNDLRDNSSDLGPKIPMLADLNEPIQVEDCDSPKIVNFSGRSACNEEIRDLDSPAKSMSQFVDLSRDFLQNSQCGSSNGYFSNLSETNKGNRRGSLSYMYEAGKLFFPLPFFSFKTLNFSLDVPYLVLFTLNDCRRLSIHTGISIFFICASSRLM